MILDVENGKVKLMWKCPSYNGGAKIKKYHIFVMKNGSRFKKFGSVDCSQLELIAKNLTPGA